MAGGGGEIGDRRRPETSVEVLVKQDAGEALHDARG
jgi:hypothetical protein